MTRPTFMVAVPRGGIQFYAQQGGQRDPIFRVETGQVSGVLPYSRLREIKNQGVAAGETVLYLLHRDQFSALGAASPELVQRLVAIMNDRSRDQVRAQERDDKLRALGKLSAGLAHELNNPAAAIARAAEALAKRTRRQARAVRRAGGATAPRPKPCAPSPAWPWPARRPRPSRPWPAPMPRTSWPTGSKPRACPTATALAPPLLEAGLSTETLAPAAALLPPAALPAAFAWLEGQLTTLQLVRDVQEAGGRISKLVADVKTYSHMDRAGGFEPLDVTAGLDSTLNMLGFAAAEEKHRLTRDYAPGLPRISGQVSSLNQVWTNLIDNAMDALPAQGGELTLRTRARGRLRARVSDGQRLRHSGRGAAAHLRALLHHQAGRRRLGPGPRHCAANHQAAQRAAGSAFGSPATRSFAPGCRPLPSCG